MSEHTYHTSGATIYRDAMWYASTQCETGTAPSEIECASACKVARTLNRHDQLVAACMAAWRMLRTRYTAEELQESEDWAIIVAARHYAGENRAGIGAYVKRITGRDYNP